MARFKKGSPEAKKYMARLRAKRKHFTLKRKAMPSNPKKRVTRVRTIKYKRKRTMPKKKRSSRKSKGMFGALQKPLIAGITYAFVQPFLSQFLSRFNIGIQDELVQILAAVILKGAIRNPIVNNWANAAIIINTASLAAGFASKILPSISAPATPAGQVEFLVG